MTDDTHRWTSRTPRVRSDGERIERDDSFAPTDHELRTWPGRIEELDADDTDGTGWSAPSDETDSDDTDESEE